MGRPRNTRRCPLAWRFPALLCLLIVGGATPTGAQAPSRWLGIRVIDAEVGPSGIATLVLETRESRPLREGRLELTLSERVFSSIASHEFFAGRGSAETIAELTDESLGQRLTLEFRARSATINRQAGPLATVALVLDDRVRPGTELTVSLDSARSFLLDRHGRPLGVPPAASTARVRRPQKGWTLQVVDDTVAPGGTAVLGIDSLEAIGLSSGVIGVRYDGALASDLPAVTMNPRHGRRQFDVSHPEPGLVRIEFSSTDSSWNLVPGEILSIRIPVTRAADMNSSSPVTIDATITQLRGSSGQTIAYRLRGGRLRVGNDDDADNDGVPDAADDDDDNDGIDDDTDADDDGDGVDDDHSDDSDDDSDDDASDDDDSDDDSDDDDSNDDASDDDDSNDDASDDDDSNDDDSDDDDSGDN